MENCKNRLFKSLYAVQPLRKSLNKSVRDVQRIGISCRFNQSVKLEPSQPYCFKSLTIVLIEFRPVRLLSWKSAQIFLCGFPKIADVIEEFFGGSEVGGGFTIAVTVSAD